MSASRLQVSIEREHCSEEKQLVDVADEDGQCGVSTESPDGKERHEAAHDEREHVSGGSDRDRDGRFGQCLAQSDGRWLPSVAPVPRCTDDEHVVDADC